MSGFQWAALLLLTANLVVGIARLRWRNKAAGGTSELKERVDALAIRVGEIAINTAQIGAPYLGDAKRSSQEALARSAAFLRQRLRAGDYGLACVGEEGVPRFSDSKGHVFVLSFIAEAMAGLLDEIDRTIILGRILSEEDAGLWGFSPPGPRHDAAFMPFHVDADDSAYVIRTLRGLGVNRPPDRLQRFYRPAERLFATFDSRGSGAALTALPSPDGNFGAHPEVNLNVFLALAGTHLDGLIDFQLLRTAQDARGFWPSFFYPSPLFATVLALDLTRGNPGLHAERDRALAFIAASQNPDGSWGTDGDPHETALAVCGLAGAGGDKDSLRRGVAHLQATMGPDGSWRSPACIWEFHAGPNDIWRAYDHHGAYVSARCLAALRRAAV